MSDGVAPSGPGSLQQDFAPLVEQRNWRDVPGWISAVIISIIFLVAGLWKITDPIGAAVRLSQAKVPESLSVFTAVSLGTVETFAGVLLLIPRFRRWGAMITSVLLVAFIVFIGIHYNELRGAECSCFPWLKRAVGPGFFAGDGAMLLFALGAGYFSVRPTGTRPATLILGAVAVFTLVSWGLASQRNTGVKAPETITAQDGNIISLKEGKVLVYFFNPQCLHCLDAGKQLAALNWGSTRFVGIPTENPQFGSWFLNQAGLTGKGPLSNDVEALKKLFPFDLPPAAVALENGVEKKMLLQFEGAEPLATLKSIGFVN